MGRAPYLTDVAKSLALRLGVDVSRRKNTLGAARERAFLRAQIDTVIDVGANIGQFGAELRRVGYRGKIISFEPTQSAYARLVERVERDHLWEAHRSALGRVNGTIQIRESRNSVSSSILSVTNESINAREDTEQVSVSQVPIKRLDDVVTPTISAVDHLFVKIDTQGYELEVLQGMSGIIERVKAIECEVSMRSLYDGQPLYFEVAEHLYQQGFVTTWIQRGFKSRENDMLQADAIFERL